MRQHLLNAEETSIILWKFVHNIQLNDFSKFPLGDEEAYAVHEIVEAAQEIIDNKIEIFELLNK
jgi:hypothetical protein